MPIQVRRANSRDADTLSRLARESAREMDGVTTLDPERFRVHAFSAHPLIEAYIAEERPGRPAGHALITKGYDFRRATATVQVGDLYVCPEYRRAGVARLLISTIAKRSLELGSREITITTGVNDAVARKFFSAIGALENQAVVFQMSGDSIEWLAGEIR